MFIYSDKTAVNINFKMLELFRTIKADKTIKTDAQVVSKVILANTLSPDRTNLEPSENVKEIYIMDIVLNSATVPTKFIDALNKYINFQILFRLRYGVDVKYITSLKVFTEDKIKVLKTCESDWQGENKEELGATSKLENVFKAMVSYITKIRFRQDETFEEYTDRTNQIKKHKKEIEKLTKTRDAEKQPNTKMAINDKIKSFKKKLTELEIWIKQEPLIY